MRRILAAFILISQPMLASAEPPRVVPDSPVQIARPLVVSPQPSAVTNPATNTQIQSLEKRLEEVERRHQQELERMRRRVEELESQLRAGVTQPDGKSNRQKPLTPQEQAEREVERMLREAEGKPAQPPAQPGAPQEQLDTAIERMLREAEAEPAPRPAGLAALNPAITLIGDFFGVLSSLPEKFDGGGVPLAGFEQGDSDGFHMREIELLAKTAIDPFADGLVKLAFTEEGVEIEEGYALFHTFPESPCTRPLEGWHLKVGIFRMSFGAVNYVDDHDLPTVDRPIAIQNFLGEEGLIRPGLSLSRSLELPGETSGEWIIELTNGAPVGDEEGAFPFRGIDNPLVLTRFKTFREFTDACACDPTRWWNLWVRCVGRSELECGVTAAYTASFDDVTDDDRFSFVEGLDLTWKGYDPRPDSYRSYLLQGELFASQVELDDASTRFGVGAYLLGQARLDRHWFVGLRGDAVEFPDTPGHQFAVTPFVTYFFSEFNRLRLQYQFLTQNVDQDARDDIGAADGHTVWVHWVWAIGAHPPEPYYVSPRF